jgi:cephalosporin-C deacetylase-like acetyl esterase
MTRARIHFRAIPPLLVFMALLGWAIASPALAGGGFDPADPMVRITAPKINVDAPTALAAVSREVSAATGLGEELITYYWQTFDSVHCMGKPSGDKPLFVDLYVPGFLTDEQVASLMKAIAESLAKNTGVDKKWVFIHTHFPLQGQVYISGEVSHWDNYRGQAAAKPGRDIAERALDKFLFHDPAFVFQSLWRTGLIASGGADLGEVLTVASRITDGDTESWHKAWSDMAQSLRSNADAYAAAGHNRSAMQAYFRAANAFRASAVYLYGDRQRGQALWQEGRDVFLKAAALSNGRIQHVRIPYEGTTLPGYLVTPEGGAKKRPLLLIQTGLDGTAEDLYFILGAIAAQRGYACLIYEGPGQGEMIVKQGLPFRYDWEKVVSSVVDFAVKRPEVDPERIAVIGYSMGGYLVPRALAFEKRIKWGIADGGVMSVFDGTMLMMSEELRNAVGKGAEDATVNELAAQVMGKRPEVRQFINQMLWTFKCQTPSDLFRTLKQFTVVDSIGQIKTEMLVVNSTDDRVAGSFAQAKLFYNTLSAKKTYLEFDASQGAQFHCQLGAPMLSSENILNWLDARAKPQP